jgi:hypothetical protein
MYETEEPYTLGVGLFDSISFSHAVRAFQQGIAPKLIRQHTVRPLVWRSLRKQDKCTLGFGTAGTA